ncbi:MAG: hypothetical protein JWM16_181 [Verrucomicrobiales bacterium]|nr:hypothetical protein [Verrucomicrobiales bacterium]
MFNLDDSIKAWQQQLDANGLHNPDILEELESHLRDDIKDRLQAGANPEQAFALAVQRLGQPELLEREFEKTTQPQERVKEAFLTLAGIPNQYITTPMITTTEPRWATYLRATAFLAPPLFLWAVAAIFIIPKLQMLCQNSGLGGTGALWTLTHTNILTTNFFRHYGWTAALCIIAVLVFLEWRSTRWPRYRRAAVGTGTFLLNLVVLLSIFMMIMTAVMVAATR